MEYNPEATNFKPQWMQGMAPAREDVAWPYTGPQYYQGPPYLMAQYPVVPLVLQKYLMPQYAVPLEAAHEYMTQNPAAVYQVYLLNAR